MNQSLFGYVSTCYKAVNTKNKSYCVLRRLHGKQLYMMYGGSLVYCNIPNAYT